MNDLDRLTLLVTEEQARGIRLGYALGLLHGADELNVPCIDLDGPEVRALADLGLPS